jgi:hypothetical protein
MLWFLDRVGDESLKLNMTLLLLVILDHCL